MIITHLHVLSVIQYIWKSRFTDISEVIFSEIFVIASPQRLDNLFRTSDFERGTSEKIQKYAKIGIVLVSDFQHLSCFWFQEKYFY